ncbi:MAG: DMT family transporter [Clostridia bacterium]|nr:DMT family transporter [Clostridia bacterium]
MKYVLLLCSVLCAGLKSVFSKKSNDCLDEKNNIYTFNLFLFLTGGIIFLVLGWREIFPLRWETLILAVLYAFFTLSSQILLMQATKHGDVALTSMFYSSGFLVPIIFSAFAYGEYPILRQYIGIAILLVAFAVGVKVKNGGVSLKWLLYAVSAMLAAGSVAVIQKVFRMSEQKNQMYGFLVISFAIMVLATLIIMPKKRPKPKKGFYQTAIIIGLCMAGANILNLYLSGVLPSVIVFSVLNGGAIVSSAVFARILVKEKLSVRKKIGVALAIGSILLIAC